MASNVPGSGTDTIDGPAAALSAGTSCLEGIRIARLLPEINFLHKCSPRSWRKSDARYILADDLWPEIGIPMKRLLLASIVTICSSEAMTQAIAEVAPGGEANWSEPRRQRRLRGRPLVIPGRKRLSGHGRSDAGTGPQRGAIAKAHQQVAFGPNVYGRAYQMLVGLEPFTTYRVSCYVKGKNVGIAWIGGGPGWFHRQRFPEGTYDWKYIESLWTSGAGADDYELIICTESPTEAVWIDDVKFEPISIDRAKHDASMAKFNQSLAAQQKHLAAVTRKIAPLSGAEYEPTIHLGVHVARRFLDRVTSLPPSQSMVWSTMQLEEIDIVLNETDKQVERFRARR